MIFFRSWINAQSLAHIYIRDQCFFLTGKASSKKQKLKIKITKKGVIKNWRFLVARSEEKEKEKESPDLHTWFF
jgi:hypothetical protein